MVVGQFTFPNPNPHVCHSESRLAGTRNLLFSLRANSGFLVANAPRNDTSELKLTHFRFDSRVDSPGSICYSFPQSPEGPRAAEPPSRGGHGVRSGEHLSEEGTVPTAATAPLPGFGPVAPHARIETLDILRGWAVFGILLMDIEALYRPEEATWTGTDQGVYQFLALFGDAKFWTLLSFLFGLGFALQLIRAEGRGPGFIALHRRRLLALLLIAVAQRLFINFGGHFLIIYGTMGFLLLALRGLPSRTLLPAAVAFTLIPWAYSDGLTLIRERRLANLETRAEVLRADTERRAVTTALQREAAQGGYHRQVAVRAKLLYRQ